jgi:uncharacterized protein YcfJ
MSRNFTAGAIAGALAITAGGAFAGYTALKSGDSATVVSVTPATRTIKTPREDCRDEAVTRQKPVKDDNRLVGTGIGVVVGGLLGNQVGGGDGKKLATVAGAAAGGVAGNQIQKKIQNESTETVVEQRCTTAYDTQKVDNGFEVVYMLDGQQHTIHMDRDPGNKIPVKDGRLDI